MSHAVGTALILIGLGLIALGVIVRLGLLAWFGHLPGDIRVEGQTLRIYVPLTSMLVVSLALSGTLYLVRRWL
jgi:hypothetical protein